MKALEKNYERRVLAEAKKGINGWSDKKSFDIFIWLNVAYAKYYCKSCENMNILR